MLQSTFTIGCSVSNLFAKAVGYAGASPHQIGQTLHKRKGIGGEPWIAGRKQVQQRIMRSRSGSIFRATARTTNTFRLRQVTPARSVSVKGSDGASVSAIVSVQFDPVAQTIPAIGKAANPCPVVPNPDPPPLSASH